ncbi:MAG: alpha/beta hydrolase [Dietzia sp.]|nr:alpha/beta hydrolase [Dietzia sp.]
MLAGAGVAAADDSTSSGSGAQGSSGSSDSDKPKAGPKAKSDTDKPSKSTAEAGDSDDDSDDSRDAEDSDAASDGEAESEVDPDDADTPDDPESPDEAESPDDDAVDPGAQSAEPETSDGGKHRAPETDESTPSGVAVEVVAEAPIAGVEPEPAAEPAADITDAGTDTEEPSTLVASIETDLTSEAGAVVMRAAAESVPWAADTPPALLAFFNDVGTMVYNFYTSTMQFLAGPARAPFGSSVRVERSTLTLGGGVVVPADWYFPDNDEPPTGLIYLQHGFLATASFYSATAAYLAEKTNSIVVAPTLTWNIFDTENYPLMLPQTHRAVADLFLGDRSVLNASARAAGFAGTLPTRVVLAGHSAGGGLVTGTARYLVESGAADDLAGVLMFDGAGFLDHMSLDLAKIPHSIPVYNLAAEPDSWNTYGDANIRLAQARPGVFTGVLVEGGRHSDSMQSASPIIQFMSYLATGFSSPVNINANEILGAGWINDMFAGTHTAKLYGPAGATLNIVDGWWQRVAHVLPTDWINVSLSEHVYACLLNPTTLYCSYLPWYQAAHWFDPMVPPRPETVAA